MYALHTADIVAWAKDYTGELFHAVLCDSPYELREVDMAEVQDVLTGTHTGRTKKGFMQKEWDGTGVCFRVETWRTIARVLHPGAFLFVFVGQLNGDLISLAMRLAGLRKHHEALYWAFGSGLQKSTRMDDKLDRRNGTPSKKVGTRRHEPKLNAGDLGCKEKDNGYNSHARETFDVTEPVSDLATTWQNHRYGLQTVRPMTETILVFQKPYDGDALTSITTTGAGALNIEAARIGDEAIRIRTSGAESPVYGRQRETTTSTAHTGRWPASLLIAHTPDCTADACDGACAVAALGAQSGVHRSKRSQRGTVALMPGAEGTTWRGESTERGHDDEGTAARFFFNADYVAERIEAADPVRYVAKVSTKEREAGLEALPIVNGDGATARRNPHATLKPIALTRYLASLLLPPAAYTPRRILIPFAGVGSEMIGAVLAGWDEVVGVELMEHHATVGQARLAYWSQRQSDGAATVKKATNPAQLPLL